MPGFGLALCELDEDDSKKTATGGYETPAHDISATYKETAS
ncbi:MAG: hypothetical protein OXC72_08390 [Roseovarius sp.]|nr:hypothetical protein [Roseovarius sp.]MCY4291762.1 hypothetical protein [Roseovarius sp.]MCY4317186.1 hypothetical protein [Roseovarius sp.]